MRPDPGRSSSTLGDSRSFVEPILSRIDVRGSRSGANPTRLRRIPNPVSVHRRSSRGTRWRGAFVHLDIGWSRIICGKRWSSLLAHEARSLPGYSHLSGGGASRYGTRPASFLAQVRTGA